MKVKLKVAPVPKVWLPKAPVSLVTVWGTESLFVQITLPPTGMVTVAGEKAKPERLTSFTDTFVVGVGDGGGGGGD